MPELIPGGKAPGGRCPRGVDPSEIARGILVEMEHTTSPRMAREIACDHLTEDPHYYTRLAQIHLDGVGFRMARPRARIAPRYMAAGSCGAGCWLERGPDGKDYCYCGDTGFKGAASTARTLAFGGLIAAAFVGAIAGHAIKKRTVRGYR